MQNVQFHGEYKESFNHWWRSETCNEELSALCFTNAGIYFMQFTFYNSFDVYDNNEPYYAAIYNQNGGTLNMTNLYIGIGAHFSVLYNRGTASINGVYTEFSQNISAYYDRWNLRLSTMITNSFGTLCITDSDIMGADTSLIDIYGGTVELRNVTLAQSMMGITTYYSAESISMENVTLYEIGKFYASLGAAIYHYGSDSFGNVRNRNWFVTPPCHLSANAVTLTNSRFSYLDSFGVLTFSEYGIYDPEKEDSQAKSLELTGNQMAMILVPHSAYEGYLYRTDFSALDKMLNESFSGQVPVKYGRQFIDTAQELMNKSTGLIVVENGYEFVVGNNDILVDAELRVNDSRYAIDPYLYIDSGSFDGCIAGNDLENIDIVVISGNIKSCKHYAFNISQVQSDLLTFNRKDQVYLLALVITLQPAAEQCVSVFGSLDIGYEKSRMKNSAMIIGDGVVVVMDDLYISSHSNPFEISQNIAVADGVRSLFIDTVLDESVDLVFPSFCRIACHQIVGGNMSLIRQLVVDCDSKSSDDQLVKCLIFKRFSSASLNM